MAKKFKTHEQRTGRHPAIILMHDSVVTGYLPGHELGFSTPVEQAGKYRHRLLTIHYNATSEEVIDIFRQHPHNMAVVLGESGNVIGVIFSDDVLRLLREQESASLYELGVVGMQYLPHWNIR